MAVDVNCGCTRTTLHQQTNANTKYVRRKMHSKAITQNCFSTVPAFVCYSIRFTNQFCSLCPSRVAMVVVWCAYTQTGSAFCWSISMCCVCRAARAICIYIFWNIWIVMFIGSHFGRCLNVFLLLFALLSGSARARARAIDVLGIIFVNRINFSYS